MAETKYPNVTVKLIGEDGNVFNLIGLTSRALKRNVSREAAMEFTTAAMRTHSYDEVLNLIMEWVEVE